MGQRIYVVLIISSTLTKLTYILNIIFFNQILEYFLHNLKYKRKFTMHHKVEIGVAPTEFVNAAIKLYHDGKIDDLFIKLSNLIKTYPNTYIFNNILEPYMFIKDYIKKLKNIFVKL